MYFICYVFNINSESTLTILVAHLNGGNVMVWLAIGLFLFWLSPQKLSANLAFI